MSSLHDCLTRAVGVTHRGEQSARDSDTESELEPGKLQEVLRDISHCILGNFKRIVQNKDSQHVKRAKVPKLDSVNVPEHWVWAPHTSACVALTNESMTAKKYGGQNCGFALGSVGFRSGVHSWVLELGEEFEQIAVGVCTLTAAAHCARKNITHRRGLWCWDSSGTVTSAYSSPKSLGQYSHGDCIRIELDFHKGTLTFFRNDKCAGSIGKVSGILYPCVRFYKSADQVTLKNSWAVIDQEVLSSSQDLIPACSSVIHNMAAVLMTLMISSDKPSALQQDVCAAIIDILLDHLCYICKVLSKEGRKTSYVSMLSMLNHVTKTRAADDALCMPGWITAVLTCLSHFHRSEYRRRLLPRMVDAIHSGMRLVHTWPYLRCYQGVTMHSYNLRGWTFSPTNQEQNNTYLSVDLGKALDTNWTLEFVVMCMRSADSQGKRVLAGLHDVCIMLVPSPGIGGDYIHFQENKGCSNGGSGGQEETSNSSEGAAPTTRTWFSEAQCPLDRWLLLSFVCKDGTTSVFIDSCVVASVDQAFTLSLQSIGACPNMVEAENFCGQVRECRVYDCARCDKDMLRCVCVCVIIYIYIYTYIYIYMHAFIHRCIRVCRFVSRFTCMPLCVLVFMGLIFIHLRMSVLNYVFMSCVCVCACVCVCPVD